MIADAITKPLHGSAFIRFRDAFTGSHRNKDLKTRSELRVPYDKMRIHKKYNTLSVLT